LYTLYYLHKLNTVVNLGMLGKISSCPTYPIAVILKMAMHLEDPERTALAAGEEVLRGGWYRPVAVRESWDRHSLTAQDRHQRRDQKWSDDARGAGVRRACGYQDDRGLLRA